MEVTSVSLKLDRRDSIRLWVSRSAERVFLVMDTEGSFCEFQIDRSHVEALRNELPSVLAGLDLRAIEDAECEKAEMAEQRAVDAATRALDLALTAEKAGAFDLAASLRAAAAESTAKATAVNAHVRAFEDATAAADYASEKLNYAVSQANAELRQRRDDQTEYLAAGVN